jgi:hypothetical protein
MRIFLVSVFVLISSLLMAQDTIDKGDIGAIEEFRMDLDKRFSFGEFYQKTDNEDPTSFVKRILRDQSTIHHGAFELSEFGNCIVSFASYEYQGVSIIIGLLLEPTSSRSEYRLLRTIELSSGCGEQPEVNSVFLHNGDPNSIGRELIIHASDYCGRHGKYNYIFVYNGIISNNKLKLSNYLTERCDYSEVKIGGEWDFDMGDENVEERRYNKCKYSDFKLIRAYFNDSLKK